MTHYSNTQCRKLVPNADGNGMEECCERVWYVGSKRVNTPFCEKHAKEATEERYRNIERNRS